ncbi:MAG: hypothetical protein HYX60_00530 [Legionella longbeachae]|nr:hypothetical protein [Legionella longbeachae]
MCFLFMHHSKIDTSQLKELLITKFVLEKYCSVKKKSTNLIIEIGDQGILALEYTTNKNYAVLKNLNVYICKSIEKLNIPSLKIEHHQKSPGEKILEITLPYKKITEFFNQLSLLPDLSIDRDTPRLYL